MQLACTDIGCSVVSPEEREALAYLPLRVALVWFLGLVCLRIFGPWGGLGWFGFICLFVLGKNSWDQKLHLIFRDIILNSYADHGFYLALTELNNSVNYYCLPACFGKCVSP